MLLQNILRGEWKFPGYIVSDCGAIDDIYRNHKVVETPEAAAAMGVKNGCDLECGSVYRSLGRAVAQGLIAEKDIDVALTRLMRARVRLGMFDPPERVKYARIPYSVNESPEHDQLSRRVAQESMVLLKNDGVLPLSKRLASVAVIGPNADELMSLLGNYYGTPSHPVTALAGIRQAVGPGTVVRYARGVDLIEGRSDPRAMSAIDAAYLRPAAGRTEHGLEAEYFRGRELQGAPVLSRLDSTVDFRWYRGSPTSDLAARGEVAADRALDNDNFSARWTGQIVPPVSGRYTVTVVGDDGFRLFVDGKPVIDSWTTASKGQAKTAELTLEAGKPVDVRLEYFEAERDAEIRLAWQLPGAKAPIDEALDAARASDVTIFVGGLTGDVEGEEMQVSYPGFAGGDRTDIALPAPQEQLLEALAATGKPVVFVQMAGSAVVSPWVSEHLPAILVAWYPGQRGGNAIADVLFGDANPAGRLPVTFYRGVDQLPAFDDYAMTNRTYRYFTGTPLYPFGYGLSYTRFTYRDLDVNRAQVAASDVLEASVTVTNSGQRAGDEVVQLYERAVSPSRPMPLRQLRGFARVTLAAGESRRVTFPLRPVEDFGYYDEAKKAFTVDSGDYEIAAGGSSADLPVRKTVTVE